MVGLATAAVVGLGGLTTIVAPAALADTQSYGTGTATATASVADAIAQGNKIHLEGSGWTGGNDPANGSTIGVKLDGSNTGPVAGKVTNPGKAGDTNDYGIWAAIEANADGTFSADLPYPTTANTSPAINSSDWAAGTTHTLRLLTGSMEEGDTPRTLLLTFQVTAGPAVTASTGGRGATPDQVTLTATAPAAYFKAGEKVSATVDGTPATWTVGSGTTATTADTVAAGSDGALASSKLVFAGGTLRAGSHAVVLTGDQGTTYSTSVAVSPALTFSALTLGSTGTLSLADLPTGQKITAATLPGATFTGLPVTAATDGTATVHYTIAKNAPLGTQTATVTGTGPNATYTSSVKVSPNAAVVGADKFTIASTASGAVASGLYQSAYSAKQHALYVSDSNALYKLNPDTLAVEAKIDDVTKVTDPSGTAGQGTYGIGVDDTNGTVWVTNTRATGGGTVAIYDENDLSLLRQWTPDVAKVDQARDVIADPADGYVFVSSASEGATGNGYISVFEAADKDGDGVRFEKIKDIALHPRTEVSPMAVAFDAASHKLWTVSSTSTAAEVINTQTLTDQVIQLPGLSAVGRGASGVAYDAANNRLYVASQNTDSLLIANASTGATIKQVPTGTQALNVALDPVHKLVYVANFGGSTVTVTDLNGNVVGNLPIAKANHVSVDGRGNAYVVDKSADNKVWKITPKATTGGGTTTIPGNGHATTPSVHDQQVAKAKSTVTKDKAKVKKLKKKLKKAHGTKAKQLKKKLKKAKKQLKKAKKQLNNLK